MLSEDGETHDPDPMWDRTLTVMGGPRDPRLLVLATNVFEHGGIGRCTRTLLAALSESYSPDRVALLDVWGGPQHMLPRLARVDGAAPWASRGVPVLARIRFTRLAMERAYKWRSDVVIIANHPHLAPVAWLAARLADAPYAVWAHGFEAWAPDRVLVRRALARACHVWAVSGFTADQMTRNGTVPTNRIRLLRHALPNELRTLGQATRVERSALRVLTVARLVGKHAYKGVDTLIAAWPQVVAAVTGACLEIIGGGDDRERLESLAAKRGVSDHICFRGFVTDEELASAYRSARVFALPGRARISGHVVGEGFGLVFLEAAAAGLPVVAGRAAGAMEAVVHGETGFLVDPENLDAVAQCIVRLLRDEELAASMGAAGRRRVEREFSLDAFRVRVEELVDELRGQIPTVVG